MFWSALRRMPTFNNGTHLRGPPSIPPAARPNPRSSCSRGWALRSLWLHSDPPSASRAAAAAVAPSQGLCSSLETRRSAVDHPPPASVSRRRAEDAECASWSHYQRKPAHLGRHPPAGFEKKSNHRDRGPENKTWSDTFSSNCFLQSISSRKKSRTFRL